MAIYHLSVQTISRGNGKSCVAAAAYRSGENLHDERQDINHDYTKKHDIESEIIAPSNAPSWVNNREKLWNEVDRAETRCNSRTARELNIALPVELSKDQQKDLARNYVKDSFVNKGMVADLCFHFNDSNNPHCHVMLTTREISEEGFTKKNRDWDKKELVEEWREQWANYTNKALEKVGLSERIDHRSYKDQGIDQVPTIHLGKTSNEMQKKERYNPRAEINRQIKELNQEKIIALQEYKELKAKLEVENVKAPESNLDYLKPEERAAIEKASALMKQPQTYVNSKEWIDKINSRKKELALKHTDLSSKAKLLDNKINTIKNTLEPLQRAESEFKNLPKNLFGQYKDKGRAEALKATIENLKGTLVNSGYKDKASLNSMDIRAKLAKEEMQKVENNINALEKASNTIMQGVKALRNQELREFYKEYKEVFPKAKYLTYKDMQSLKKAYKMIGRPVSIEELRAIYNKKSTRDESIDEELKQIQDGQSKIMKIKQAINIVEKYKDIADKWDTKVFGKAKFQEEHKAEKMQYDKAKNFLKDQGIKDKVDLGRFERVHNNKVNEVKPKLQAEKTSLKPVLNVLANALQAMSNANRNQEHGQHKGESIESKSLRRALGLEDDIVL